MSGEADKPIECTMQPTYQVSAYNFIPGAPGRDVYLSTDSYGDNADVLTLYNNEEDRIDNRVEIPVEMIDAVVETMRAIQRHLLAYPDEIYRSKP